MENKTNRRSAFRKIGMALAATFGVGTASALSKGPSSKKEVVGEIVQDNNMPLFSGAVKHGNTLYIAGKGYHKEGDIKVHTKEVLDEL